MSLFEQIASAKASVRRMKRQTPHFFLEWQRLKNAESSAKRAQAELRAAREAWKKLGVEP